MMTDTEVVNGRRRPAKAKRQRIRVYLSTQDRDWTVLADTLEGEDRHEASLRVGREQVATAIGFQKL